MNPFIQISALQWLSDQNEKLTCEISSLEQELRDIHRWTRLLGKQADKKQISERIRQLQIRYEALELLRQSLK